MSTVPAAVPETRPASSHGGPPSAGPQGAPKGARGGLPASQRQYISFACYKLAPEFRRLPVEQQKQMLDGLAAFVESNDPHKQILLTYSCVGTRPDVDILFWKISYELDAIQAFTAGINRLPIAGYLTTPHSFLAQSKRSTYLDRIDPAHDDVRTNIVPGKRKYIFVYPFVKTREWYLLSKHTRQGIMDEHIEVGNKYQSVKLNTTYSFGFDDQDFVVAFETDVPGDFLDLVQELRETEGSRYTVRDTPIFTGVQTPIRELIKQLAAI
jgi:chlorite dismutase